MKFLIIFVVSLVALVYGQHQINPASGGVGTINQDIWRQCVQESRVQPEDVNRFKNRDFTNARDTVQCFTNCLLEKMGLMQNGEISEQKFSQVLAQTIPADQLGPKISSCRAQARGTSKCENAYKFYVCLLNSTGNTDIFRFSEMN